MRLQLSPEMAEFREEMHSFFTTQVPQHIRDAVAARHDLSKDDYVEAQRVLNAAGLAVPHWPVEWGGQDWTPLQRHIWREEMQLANVPEPLAFNASMVGPVIAQFGSEELKQRFLPPTANLTDQDPACTMDYLPGVGRAARPAAALCNCLGFGSKNSAIVLGAVNA